MGFTSGFYKAKKYDKLFEYKDLKLVEAYFDYKSSSWAQQNFDTFEDYCKALDHELSGDLKEEVIKFYEKEYLDREDLGLKSLCETFADWCSNGSYFHEDIMKMTDNVNSYVGIVTKENLQELVKFAWNKFREFGLEAVSLQRVFKDRQDAFGDSWTEYREADGIEVAFADGIKKDIVASDVYETELYSSKQHMDPDEIAAYIDLLECLTRIACTTDWDNELVFYCGGW